MSGIVYPDARRDESVIDDYNGHLICDPYRWLEDPYSDETKAFVDAQNAITEHYLQKCHHRQVLKERITELWNYEKHGCPSKHGNRWFYFHNTGLQNQSVLYVQDELNGEAKEFLDLNKLSTDGTSSVMVHSFSKDGKYLAYGISDGGSDWVSIKIRKTDDGRDFDEILKHVTMVTSLAWTHNNLGFFYNAYPEQEGKCTGTETTSNINQMLCYHRLGNPQERDVVCAKWPDHPKWSIGAVVSDCGRYLVCSPREGCDPVNRLYFCNLSSLENGIEGPLKFEKVVDNFDAEYEYVTNGGSLFIFKTNLKSPRYKLITIDFLNYSQGGWNDLVPENEYDVLQWANCVNKNRLVLCYLHDVKSTLFVHSSETGNRLASLPLDMGDVVGYSGETEDTEFFYSFVSFLTPGKIYRCNMEGDAYTPEVFREVSLKNFDSSLFEATQVFYPSLDDPYLKIPMFIIHKKGLVLDGSHPLLLYGYGGFNISICPTFSISRIVFTSHMGGIVAIPNIRGGGEYGETWHKAGMLKNKQNVFNDFQAAAQYLIDSKYTSPNRIVINGGSNGGLLVAACANQRPDLFGCMIAQVGVMDMLRFHKFTIGHAWTTDYGCAEDKEDFDVLIRYSPLHNVNAASGKQFPASLLLTGDHDNRVVPLHSLKFTAELQHQYGGRSFQKNPIFIKIDTNSGHGAGKPTHKSIQELTDLYSFILMTFNLTWKE